MSKVSIQRDLCLNLILPAIAPHDFIPLPPFPPVPPPMPAAPLSLAACAFELPVPAWWPPGYALGSNKFTTTVFHKHLAVCLDGHDCGKFILHLQITPAINNLLSIPQTALSSRKANFCTSKVKMNGKGVACMTLIAWPPTPMTYCSNPISLPLADAVTAYFNSVEVGLTLGDWLGGAFAIVAGMILEYGLFKAGGGTRGFGQSAGKMIAKSKAGKSAASLLASKFKGELLPSKWGNWATKQAVGLLTGLGRAVASGSGAGTASLPVGGPFLSVTPAVAIGQNNGHWTWNASITGVAGPTNLAVDAGNSGTGTSAGVSLTARSPVGTSQENLTARTGKGGSFTETTVFDPFGGFDNSTVTKTPKGTTVVDSHPQSPPPNPL